MSSRNAKRSIPPPSANSIRRNESRSKKSNANAIMVNSDIMILQRNQQDSPSEYEDIYRTVSSDRSIPSSNTTDSLSLEQLPSPPVHTQHHSSGTVSESPPYSPIQSSSAQNKNNSSIGPYPSHSYHQYQQQPLNSTNNSINDNNVYQRSNSHEMKERSQTLSPTLSSTSTILTIGQVGSTSRGSTDIEYPTPKYQTTKRSGCNKKSNEHNPISTTAKRLSGRFSALLGHPKSENPTRRLTADTPDTQSASGSKNDLIIDKFQQYDTSYQRSGEVYGKPHSHSKTGIPGKDGEEPETNLFDFVHIMLNMPEEPTWKQVISKLLKVLVVMTISYLALMAMYYAAEFQSDSRMSNFNVLVVDLDEGIIGVNYLNFTSQLNSQPGQVNWSIESAKLYPNISAISEQVQNGNYWGAVVVQPNASSTLNRAFAIPLPDYDPTKAFAFIYDSGRNPLAVEPYILASMYTQFIYFTKFFNPAWVQFILEYSAAKNLNVTALHSAPQVLGTPVAFEEFDLHPITASIITSATSVAYIWIFLVAGGSTYLVTHTIQPMTRHSSVSKTMICMLLPLFMYLVVLSMAYSVLLPIFGVPFAGGALQFLKLFGGMLLLQCAVAAMVLFLIFLIPVVVIPCFTITFVILNVVAVFNPTELMPGFYKWVYAMPFLNAVEISRFVLMGSYNRLKYNISVLVAWIMLPIILMPFAIARQKRLAREARIREEEERVEAEFRSRNLGQMKLELVDQGQDEVLEYGRDHKIGDTKADDNQRDNDEHMELHKRYLTNQSKQQVNPGREGVTDTQKSTSSELNSFNQSRQNRRVRDK
ncbi:hypothetical protein BGZ46_006036 [Entomortierella lignicola]|nr:hypothetical protein BGZ46_006036 [Entomortierella lignicola]